MNKKENLKFLRKNIENNSLYNTLLNFSSIAVTAPVIILTLSFCEKKFSALQFGNILLYFSLLNILIYADFGRARVITSKLASLNTSLDLKNMDERLFKALLSIKYGTKKVFLKSYFFLFFISLIFIFLKIFNFNPIAYEYLIIILIIPITFILICLRGLFEGLIKFKEANYIKTLNAWTTYFPFFIMSILGIYEPIHTLFIILFLKLLFAYLFWKKVFNNFNQNFKFQSSQNYIDKTFLGNLKKDSKWSFQSNIYGALIMNGDKFIVNSIVNPSLFVIYGSTVDILSKILLIPASFSNVIIPKISRSFLSQKSSHKTYIYELTSIFISCLSFFLIFFLSDQLFSIFFNNEFASKAKPIIKIMSFSILFNSLAFYPYSYLCSFSQFKIIAKIHFCELIVFISTLLIWTINYGIVGATYAVLTRSFLDSILMYYFYIKLKKSQK